MSNSTTSPRLVRAASAANSPPMLPAPMSAILFLRGIASSILVRWFAFARRDGERGRLAAAADRQRRAPGARARRQRRGIEVMIGAAKNGDEAAVAGEDEAGRGLGEDVAVGLRVAEIADGGRRRRLVPVDVL